MPTPPLPQHCPSARELDDLELLSVGALAPTAGFNEPGSPVTLTLPDELAATVGSGGSVELVDPEGLPLASVTGGERGWSVNPLTHAQYGPFRRLYLPPAEVRSRYAGRTFVPVTDALTDTQAEQLAGLDGVVLLALVGNGTPALSPVGLLRATLRVAERLGADVVAVPLASHGDAGADAELRRQVVANYAGPDPVVELTTGGTVLAEVADIVRAERPDPSEQGLVLFFTGLSGSGKSTLAQALMDRLLEHGGRTLTSLDGDVVRRNLSAGLTFSKEDRETNIRRIGWVAAEIARHGGVAVCSPIAPFDSTRKQVRQYVEDAGGAFFLVHVATPLEECERRDRKGLYAKARRGEIPEFTGISSPYEEPQDADVRVDTTGRTIDDALSDVLVALRDKGYLDLTSDEFADAGRAGRGGLDTPSPSGSGYSTTDHAASPSGSGYSTTDNAASPSGSGYSTTDHAASPSGSGHSTTDHAASPSGSGHSTTEPPVVEVRGAPAPSLETTGTHGTPGDHPLTVLFVCTANICRSPYMELRARALQDETEDAAGRVEFASAGTHGFHAHGVDATMVDVLASRGVTGTAVTSFRSRRLSKELVAAADLVLTAEASHRAFVLEEVPPAFRKVYTLGQFAESVARVDEELHGADLVAAVGHRRAGASPAHDISDPFNRGREPAERCADQIDELLRVVLPRLLGSGRIPA